MAYPRIAFHVSPAKDVDTFFRFVADAEFDKGESVRWAILKPFPDLKKWFDDRLRITATREEIVAFVDGQYSLHASGMKDGLILIEERWHKVEQPYFALVDELGMGEWPDGKYIAYPTIWGMYPKFLDDMTFQIPWNHPQPEYVDVVIAHENLHFIWYPFFYREFPGYVQGKDGFFVWNVSEIFNSFVQNSSRWHEVFGMDSMPYPQHEKALQLLNERMQGVPYNARILTEMIIALVNELGIGAMPLT